jgi:Domain of unknown function (DUF4157)
MKESPISPQKDLSQLSAVGSEQESTGQSKAAPAFQLTAGDAPPAQRKAAGGGLPEDLVNGFKAATGHDLSDVIVHYNSDKPAQVGALAYAQGNDIYLGPGQEKHVDHEAAHLVQQREGRVQANAAVKGMAVNNSKSLESEADALATRARQMKAAPAAGAQAGGYQSKALQMRADTRGPMQMKGGVAQMKIDTKFGEWHDDTYATKTDGGLMGVEMLLRFKPKAGVNAESIGLTQSVRTIRNKAVSYPNKDAWYANRAISAKDSKTLDSSARVQVSDSSETDEGTRIDRLKNRNTPIYGSANLGAGQTLADTPESNNSTSDPTKVGDPSGVANTTYQTGYYYTASGTLKERDASLYDNPMLLSSDVSKDSGQIFETTALALKGSQAGTYYGSVRWGWRSDSAGKHETIPFEVVSEGVPSSTFLASAQVWNGSKDPSGGETVDLPIDTVFINAAPISLFKDAEMKTKDKDLPANTRMVNTSCTIHSSYGMKIVDGSDIGKTGFVDQTKIQRER